MSRSPSHAAAIVAGLAAATLGLAACGSPEPGPGAAAPAGSAPGQVQVVASTDVWGSVARAVGGDRVAVTSIIDSPEKDPHEYESTPTDATTVGGAGLVLLNGGGYDEFMPQLVQSTGTRAPVVDAAQVSGLQKPGAEEFNEHIWYSLPGTQKVAQTVASQLARIDPAGAGEYTANAQRLTAEISRLTGKVQAIGAAKPGARVAITEPLPVYLLEAAKLQNVSPEEFTEAVEEDADPPAAVLQETLALFSAQPPLSALVLNSQTQTPTTDQVRQAATSANVPVVEMSETLPEGVTDYTTWMNTQIDALARATGRS